MRRPCIEKLVAIVQNKIHMYQYDEEIKILENQLGRPGIEEGFPSRNSLWCKLLVGKNALSLRHLILLQESTIENGRVQDIRRIFKSTLRVAASAEQSLHDLECYVCRWAIIYTPRVSCYFYDPSTLQ